MFVFPPRPQIQCVLSMYSCVDAFHSPQTFNFPFFFLHVSPLCYLLDNLLYFLHLFLITNITSLQHINLYWLFKRLHSSTPFSLSITYTFFLSFFSPLSQTFFVPFHVTPRPLSLIVTLGHLWFSRWRGWFWCLSFPWSRLTHLPHRVTCLCNILNCRQIKERPKGNTWY